ncbi:hypothetical protein D3C72_1573800 [compost metagenome]
MVDVAVFRMTALPLLNLMRFQQEHCQGRDQSPREHKRAAHGEHYRQRHRPEQIACNALEHEHRDKHYTDAEERDEGWPDDLPRTIQDGAPDRLALLQVPVDVLNSHRGIVNQNPYRQCQATERHDIERLAADGQQCDRREHRQGN